MKFKLKMDSGDFEKKTLRNTKTLKLKTPKLRNMKLLMAIITWVCFDLNINMFIQTQIN